jgi:4-hydroxybenzoate polyprenyltransferase
VNRYLAYAQLVRLPNVFTAFADIAIGGLAAGLVRGDPLAFALVLAASGCLYCGGMALNDYFDRHEDAVTRPGRPIPSGRIAPGTALAIGLGLLALGIAFAAGAGATGGVFRPAPLVIAVLIAGAVLLYDGVAKQTPLAPVSMAACRFLNVLLGMSPADGEALPWPFRLHVALAVGVYIVGVTWFARREEATSRRGELKGAAGVMLAGLGVALLVPAHLPAGTASPLFVYLLAAFGAVLGVAVLRAVREPSPPNVQAAVKRAVLGLVALDAVLASAVAGTAGLLVVLLLVPAMYLGRWVYST